MDNKITITVGDEVLKTLKEKAEESGKSIEELVSISVSEWALRSRIFSSLVRSHDGDET